ncbi:DEAD/DEAH box helicase [Romboutsia sp. Marseille-P6047]|uniref:DEAD/DEAH box helicase n=1 Tax=Romboutsia sp. Marseille-P6047 TaxID=2161817 RepID=UPI000821DB80|nr:SNF2-related protein [Romboutsia sp. Marseille-P6047]SCI15945.1 ATP-dependent helicase HepA [uncultured Clostridium sp.]
MDINIIKNIIEFNSDRTRYNSGFTSYKRNLVRDSYSKEDEGIFTFYGTVLDEYSNKSYTSIIMINSKTRAILNYSCDCKDFISRDSQPKICSHIVATVLSGTDSLNKKEDFAYKENIDNIIDPSLTFNTSQSRGGYIGVDLDIDGINKNEYRRIFNSYKENKKLHRLSTGSYLDLKNKDLINVFKIIDTLGIYIDFDNMKIPNNKSMYLENVIEKENIDFVVGKNYITNISKRYKKVSKFKHEIPINLNAKLRDYQIKGFDYLNTLSDYEFGGILADEMGLGKTLQAISFLLYKKEKKSIVITPTALIHNWKNEFEKFAPSLNIGLAHGNKAEREKIISRANDYDIVLTTYNTYRNDQEQYKGIKFDYCFIDEAQNIKNPDSIISKTIKGVNAKIKFALTGTPIENNLIELWSIFDFIMPNYLYSKERFKNIFVNDEKNREELKRMIQPFILRRTKTEVIKELPDKIEHKYYIELEKEHKRAYIGFVKLIKNKIKEISNDNISIFSYLTKLRQLVLAPEIMVKNYKGKNSKIDILFNIIDENKDRKILVFSQFTKVLNLIEDKLNEKNISYSYLDGKTNAKDRIRLVDEFNANENIKIFLISLKAGGTGLNLTSASMVIHFDPWWNPSVENQASDRAHRIGQKNVVDVVKLIAKDTVEERVVGLQESKKDLIDNVIDNNLEDSSILKNLSKDNLIDLFM